MTPLGGSVPLPGVRPAPGGVRFGGGRSRGASPLSGASRSGASRSGASRSGVSPAGGPAHRRSAAARSGRRSRPRPGAAGAARPVPWPGSGSGRWPRRTPAGRPAPRPAPPRSPRSDVLVFTSAPLTAALDVVGPVSARIRVRASGRHFDLFARLCDVDPRGRSRNVCDGIVRCDAVSPGPVSPGPVSPGPVSPGPVSPMTVPMSATAHRFAAGHRLRLQISGGAHPRFARNTGSGEPPATATRLAVVDLQILHEAADPCMVLLPVLSARSDPGGGSGTLGRHHTSRSPDAQPRAAGRASTGR